MSIRPIKCKCGGSPVKYPIMRIVMCDKCGWQTEQLKYISEAVREWNLKQRSV